MQAQERLCNANILLVNIKALGNEIAKNLVLAGIGSLTLVDNNIVTEDDLGAQFFISPTDIGKPRAEAAAPEIRKLNPRVTVHVSPQTLDTLSSDPTIFSPYDIVIATDLPITAFSTLNAAARLSNRPFYAAGSHGMYGFLFADLISHTFSLTREKSNAPPPPHFPFPETATRTILSLTTTLQNGQPTELITKREVYQPLVLANTSPLAPEYLSRRRLLNSVTPLLPCLRALWEFERSANRPPSHSAADLQHFTALATDKSRELRLPLEALKSEFLRGFLQNLYAEVAPVTAFLGGKCAEDVVNVLGGREQPIQNMLLFDGEASLAPVYALYPIVPTTAVEGKNGEVFRPTVV